MLTRNLEKTIRIFLSNFKSDNVEGLRTAELVEQGVSVDDVKDLRDLFSMDHRQLSVDRLESSLDKLLGIKGRYDGKMREKLFDEVVSIHSAVSTTLSITAPSTTLVSPPRAEPSRMESEAMPIPTSGVSSDGVGDVPGKATGRSIVSSRDHRSRDRWMPICCLLLPD